MLEDIDKRKIAWIGHVVRRDQTAKDGHEGKNVWDKEDQGVGQRIGY